VFVTVDGREPGKDDVESTGLWPLESPRFGIVNIDVDV